MCCRAKCSNSRASKIAQHVAVSAIIALVVMLLAADVLVRSATNIASDLGWSTGLIGLTIVAIGTSGPLIAAGIQAARRGEEDIVVGNVLGGNLFIALIGGALMGLLARGDPTGLGDVSVVAMVLLAILSWAFMARGGRTTRPEAVIMILAYLALLPLIAR